MRPIHILIIVLTFSSALFAQIFNNHMIVYGTLGILLFAGLFNPLLSLTIFLLLMPYAGIAGGYTYQFNAIIFIGGVVLNRLIINKDFSIINRHLVYIFLLTSIMLLTLLINLLENINLYILFSLSVTVFMSIVFVINDCKKLKSNSTIVRYVFWGILLAGIWMSFTVLIESDFVNWQSRLRYDGRVRYYVNFLKMPILILFMGISDSEFRSIVKINRVLSLFLITLFSVIVVLSGSRGIAFSLAISLIVYTAFKLRNQKSLLFIFPILALLIISTIFVFNLDQVFHLDRILTIEPSGRLRIWSSVLREHFSSGLPYLIFGNGLGAFRGLADAVVDWETYSHSVFIDTLVSFGILGFGLMLIVLMNLAAKPIKAHNLVAITMLLLVGLSYFNHGNAQSMLFWVYLAIASALPSISVDRRSSYEINRFDTDW